MNLRFMKRSRSENDTRYVDRSVNIEDMPFDADIKKVLDYLSTIKALDDIPMEEFPITCETIDSVLNKIRGAADIASATCTTFNLGNVSRAIDHLTDMLGVLRIVGDCQLDHLQASDKAAFFHFVGPSTDEYRQSPFSILFDNELGSVQVVKDIGDAGGVFYSFDGIRLQYGFMATLINGLIEPITRTTYSFFEPGKNRTKFELKEDERMKGVR